MLCLTWTGSKTYFLGYISSSVDCKVSLLEGTDRNANSQQRKRLPMVVPKLVVKPSLINHELIYVRPAVLIRIELG